VGPAGIADLFLAVGSSSNHTGSKKQGHGLHEKNGTVNRAILQTD